MIAFLSGQVQFTEGNAVVLVNNGVGYLVNVNKYDLGNISLNSELSLFIHTHVKEDAIDLYGFSSQEKKAVFQMLISLSGIGPKIAMNILSSLHLEQLIEAIITKDIATLCSMPGIGKKSAERMVLELKEKALKLRPSMPSNDIAPSIMASLQSAIRGLGYSSAQSEKAISLINKEDFERLPLDALIRKTLNVLVGANAHDHN